MADTYFASFCLGDPESRPPALNDVVAVVREWVLQERPGVHVHKLSNVHFDVTDDHVAGNGRLQIRRNQDADANLFALRLIHPDRNDTSLIWESEVVLAHDIQADQLRVAIRTSCGHSRDYVAPIDLPAPSRPRIVKMLVQKFGAFEGSTRLKPVAIPVAARDFDEHFIAILDSSERAVPLVVISTRTNDRPLVDPIKVADQLAGLAVVCAFENRFVSFRLTDALGEEWSVRNGAVRIYWPKLDRASQQSLRHPLLLPRNIENFRGPHGIPRRLLGMVSRAATQRVATGLARWSEVERRIQLARRKDAQDRGDREALLSLLEEENVGLTQRKAELDHTVANLEIQILNAIEDAEKARDEATYWREEFFRLQKSRTNSYPPQAPEPLANSVADALNRVEMAYPDRLSIKLSSVSNKSSPYQDAESFYKALVFLATAYVDARRGTRPCQDLDASCRSASGFQYKSGQSAVTVGRYRHDYETTWHGKKIPLEEHLSKGADRDPRYAIRIGFFSIGNKGGS